MTEMICHFICRKLVDFLRFESKNLIEVVRFYEKSTETALDTTPLGRDLFLGYLRYMTKKHRAGKAWNGDFCIGDLEVMDGCIFEITKDTTVHASCQAMEADMKKLVEILVQFYQISPGSMPCYFAELQSDMYYCFESLGQYNSAKTVKFHKYLESHLALKSAMARSHLFLDLYRVRLSISKDDFQKLQNITRRSALFWISEAKKNCVLSKTLGEGVDKSDTRTDRTTQSTTEKDNESDSDDDGTTYANNLDHLLLFIRHVAQHGADHTKV